MHRSRLSVLTIFAAAAACSTHDDSGAKALAQDPSLVATLAVRQRARLLPLPDACGAVAVASGRGTANKPQAEDLARKAYDAELVGNTETAHTLLLRASALDGTDKSAAYHLGRTSEAVGDRDGATTGYCRYLALAPTVAESAEARQRLARLSQSEPRAQATSVRFTPLTPQPGRVGNVRRIAHTRRAGRARAGRARLAAMTRVVPRMRTASAGRDTRSAGVRDGMDNLPAQGDGAASSTDVERRGDRTSEAGDGVATSTSAPTVDQPSPASRTGSRGPSRAQSAGIGAMAGAILGAATGRSMSSAVIGAAAGGVLGTMVGGGIRPAGRGVEPWAARTPQPAGTRFVRRPY